MKHIHVVCPFTDFELRNLKDIPINSARNTEDASKENATPFSFMGGIKIRAEMIKINKERIFPINLRL
jgi:hypothetical protein